MKKLTLTDKKIDKICNRWFEIIKSIDVSDKERRRAMTILNGIVADFKINGENYDTSR